MPAQDSGVSFLLVCVLLLLLALTCYCFIKQSAKKDGVAKPLKKVSANSSRGAKIDAFDEKNLAGL